MLPKIPISALSRPLTVHVASKSGDVQHPDQPTKPYMYVYTVCVYQYVKNNIIHIHIEVKNALPNKQALRAGHINGTEVDSMLLEFLPACSCEYSCVHYDSCGGLLS